MSGPYYRGSQVEEEAGQEKLEAGTRGQQRLEGKQQEKAFEQAMIEPPWVAFMKHSLLQSPENLLFSRP